jgi:hypothetical protein
MKACSSGVVLGAVLGLLITSGKASTISGTLLSVSPGENISFHLTPVGGGTTTTESTIAGLFNWQGAAGNPAGFTGTFNTFCIDLFQFVHFGSPAETWDGLANTAGTLAQTPVGGGNGTNGMGANAVVELERLWTADSGMLSANPNTTGNEIDSAFQIAIWEIVTQGIQGAGHDLSYQMNGGNRDYFYSGNGNAVFSNITVDNQTQTLAYANQFLTDSQNTSFSQANLGALYSSSIQDQTVLLPAGAPVPGPLPSAVWGGGLLLGGLLFVSRRRNRTQVG